MSRIIEFFKRLFKKQEPNPITEYNKAKDALGLATKKLVEKGIDVGLDYLANKPKTEPFNEPRYTPLFVPKPGSQATSQDIGKFMHHGKQAPYYRKSVKAKIQPEDEN